MVIVGKIHKHAHLNMLMKGRVSVFTEKGREDFTGPLTMVSQAGRSARCTRTKTRCG
jgi:hypothetical protein